MATSPTSESLDAAFQAAVASFAAGLTDKQRRQFQGCTLKEVEDTIKGVEARLASQRQQRNMQMVSKFLEGMDQLGKVIEVFVNCDSTVAFIWGPIKFILLAIGTWVETLDCLLDTYVEIGEFLPSLSTYGNLLAKYPGLGIHLHRYYCDVLEFHRNALSVFSRPSWKTAFYSAWRNFKTQFGPILSKLKRHRDLLSGEKLTAVITDVHQSVQAVEDKVDTLSRQLQHLYIDDAGLSRRYREDINQKRELVLHKLDPPDYHHNLEKASYERRDSTSGNWLLADTTFREWVDVTSMELRTLFLNGIPGSGKTIVTARVVQHLKQLQAEARAQVNGSGFILLYFFFNHHQPGKRTFVSMLLSFLSQILFQDDVLIDLIYQRCIRTDQQKIRSASLLGELVALALKAQRRCFVVVDGLDECDDDQPGKPQAAQGKVIDWLESLHAQEADTEPTDRYTRLLISGQRNGVLDERLKHWPAIQLDSSRSHMDDIKTYCEVETLQLREEFDGMENLEDIRLDIIRRVTSRAKGMFLYAKVVLRNLLDQPTLGDFERELDEENFPQGMDEAYERVAVNILEDRLEKRFGVARRILNLVICAERPLRWKEIQSHFSIGVQSGTANPKLRLLKPGKKFCGSLIEVSRKDVLRPQGSGPDDVLELVHETARKYLLQTAKFHFHLADLHAEMALFCAQYLCSVPFNPDTSKPDVKMHCIAGYYGFLDYAAAYWWKHGRRAGGCGGNAALEAMANLADALSLQRDTPVVQTLRQLSDDGRDWERTFPIRNRIEPIRNHLEELLGPSSTMAPADVNRLRELYGRLTYKCPKPWCLSFEDGLTTASNRDDHVRQHELPFRCDTEGCYRLQIGFAKESDLVRHKERLHSNAVSVGFPPIRRGNIFKAAAQGRLETVQDLVAYGASVNDKDKSGSTPLFLAARARNIEVCRWLLEHGAEVDDRCTTDGLTALHAAVANDDVEVVTLLIADHDADIHIRTSTGKSIQTLVEENGCLNVRKAFPIEFWKHELLAPQDRLAFGDFDPERVPNHFKKVRGDWSAVFNQAASRVLDVDLLHTFEHESIVCCVKFSHDGKYLATGCNRSVVVYDVASGEKISVLQYENAYLAGDLYIRDVCFSPDGRYLATGSEDKLVKVWDLQINQVKATFAGHDQDIYSIDFSNDGYTIASGSGDRTARTWDLETGTAGLVYTTDDGITSVAISPDNKLLAAGSLDRSARVWDIKLGYLLYHLEGHLDGAYGVAFSPNSCRLLSVSLDKNVKMWELNTSSPMIRTNQAPPVKNGHCIRTFKGHLDFALSVTMTPDSEWVISGSKDRSVHFWDPWTGQLQFRLLGHKNSVISVASSPAGTRTGGLFATASGDKRARIWSYTRFERTES